MRKSEKKNINEVGMDLITTKYKLLGGLINNFCWGFLELQEEFRCAAVTALQQKSRAMSRSFFWYIKRGLKMEGAENQGTHS